MTKFRPEISVWDKRFMQLAYEIASWSKDPDEQVGAVVVSTDHRYFSIGYNGLPRGMPDTPEILNNKELKNTLTIHAEQNAIINARCNLKGWTIYTTKAPCLNCALIIHQNQISCIVCPPIRVDSRWATEQYKAVEIIKSLNIVILFMPQI